MQSWQSVVVSDEELEAFGRAGKVTSAVPFKGAGKDREKEFVDVMLDATPTLEAEAVTIATSSLRALS